jgi:dTDP-D-glucose 4,6-dehydratase
MLKRSTAFLKYAADSAGVKPSSWPILFHVRHVRFLHVSTDEVFGELGLTDSSEAYRLLRRG